MKLPNGADLTFDWEKISQAEWQTLLDDDGKTKVSNVILGKLTGMSIDEIGSLNPIEYRKTVLMGAVNDWVKHFQVGDVKN